MKQLLIVIPLILFITSCSVENESEDLTSFAKATCSFDLQEGQIDKYLFFMSDSGYFFGDSVTMCRTGDTLLVEVLEKVDSSSYRVREYFSAGSKIHTADDPSYYWGNYEDTLYHTWSFVDTNLVIDQDSPSSWSSAHLTYFATEVPLDVPNNIACTFTKWKPEPLFADNTSNYIVNSQEYLSLDVYVNNSPMAVDGNGMTMTYSKQYGIVTTFTVSSWFDAAQGWLRL